MKDPGEEGERPVGFGWVRWLFTTDHEAVVYVREVAGSVAAVALVGALLFAVSGVWPPLVAIESESMEPHISKGDLVFVMEEERFADGAATMAAGRSTGVVTYQTGQETGYTKFSEPGDVIVYQPDGSGFATPIIHRAMFWVEDGENWYDRANPEYVGRYDACETDDDPVTDTGLPACPAPNAGFITKGDNGGTNGMYDQAAGIADSPVKPAWIVGTAEFRIPLLGHIRLLFGLLGGSVETLATVGAGLTGGIALALDTRSGT
jgi:signal peptidase